MRLKDSPLVELKKVTLQIGQNSILKEVSFTIDPQEIVSIVGESGSGKSLTALSLLGLQPKNALLDSDKMEFDKTDLRSLSTKDWRKIRGNSIGMIFQEPQSSLNPSMRCGKQLLEVLQQHTSLTKKKQKEIVIELMKEVQLNDPKRILHSYPHQLSGGQKQRIMIAMALLCKPKLLIADEPTTALDVMVQKEIIKLLKALQKKYRMSILFISHDLALVKQLADRILVMYNGEIVESGTPENLFKNPKHPYTKGLLYTCPKTDLRLKQLPTLLDYEKDNFTPSSISKKQREQDHQNLYKKKPIIEVQGLEKTYSKRTWRGTKNHFQALHSLDFVLYPGETLGLVGESGSGKSTIAKAMVFLDPPTQGSILYKGKSIASKNHKALNQLRKEVQFIFQDPYAALHPQKTIGKALEEVLYVHQIEKTKALQIERANELLKQVGLNSDYYKRYPHELSGGQCQRAVIARALATEPRVLICDESVAALDISVQAQVLNLLNHLKEVLGLSYLFISHDLSVVKFMSDRILVLQAGRLVEMQEADSLYENPREAYTKKLISSIH